MTTKFSQGNNTLVVVIKYIETVEMIKNGTPNYGIEYILSVKLLSGANHTIVYCTEEELQTAFDEISSLISR